MAIPLIVSTASLTIMMFVDRMFLCWSSEKAVAAALPAGMTYFAVVCFPLGVASYVNTFVAQYFGAGRPRAHRSGRLAGRGSVGIARRCTWR